MQTIRISAKAAIVTLALAAGAFAAVPADARTHHASGHGSIRAHLASRFGYSHGYGGISCVPFARENTGIEISGNAGTWWSGAEGVYQRGQRPEVGSVLNFRANGHMRMGHVAVVSNVVDSRNIEIDHANWAGPGGSRGGVSRNINVVDVSPGNDWTAVRVALGHTDTYGSVYPTFGFIYDRPDNGVRVANAGTAPVPALNAPPRDLRPASERLQVASLQADDEVAEAADDQPTSFFPTRRHGRLTDRHAKPGLHGARTERFARAERGAHGDRFARPERFAHNDRFARTERNTHGPATVTRVQSHGASATRHEGHRHRT